MENKAHFALIGSFVIMALIAAVSFAMWLSNSQFDQQFDNYEVIFNGPVRGLSEGSEVRLNGLKVGDVTRLRFEQDNPNAVIVDIQVNEGTPIFADANAKLEPQGITGLSYLQIFPGTVEGGRMPEKGSIQIPGEMSQLDEFFVGGENVIEGANRALARVNAVLSEDAIRNFHGILSNLNQITTNLRDTDIDPMLVESVLKSFEQAAKDVSAAAIAVDVAAQDFDTFVNDEVKVLVVKATASLDGVDQALADISELANDGSFLTTDARDAINRLSNSGLTDLEETADGMRRLIIALTEIAEKLERSPVEFIAGEEMETVELPQ